MSPSLFERTPLEDAFVALRKDLIHADGPRISTMRNRNLAIMQYDPKDEFKLRGLTQTLSQELVANGWVIVSISLQKLLLERVREQGQEWLDWVIQAERDFADYEPERGLNFLKDELRPLIEGAEGLAADCAKQICAYVDQHPDKKDRTLALIGRAGALYPFFRSSSLLKHLDGRTKNVPVVLLYPGQRRGHTGLSFMGMLDPDNDYRPRIYP